MKLNTFKNKFLLLLFLFLGSSNLVWASMVDGKRYIITDYGAVADNRTDNSNVINKVIDIAYKNGGGVVVIPKAMQPFIFIQINVKSNVTLKGEGGILKFKDNVAINKKKAYYPINNLGYNNSSFINLIIDGNMVKNTDFSVCDMITCIGENSKVISCKIYNAPDSGIMFSNTKNGVCQNNEIIGGRDCGIYINANSKGANSGSVINNNTVKNFIITGIAVKRHSYGVTIDSNSIEDCGNGISI
uniref:glycosyl hydrolase family 28-related protein n=1 Tax=Chryseobacterium sp. TaxID=1871047 RepID=UPI0025B97EC8